VIERATIEGRGGVGRNATPREESGPAPVKASAPHAKSGSAHDEASAPPGAPSVRVLLFGRVRELAGSGETTVAVPAGATVGSVADRLAAATPAVAPHLGRCSFAVNAVYARRDAPVRAGDEVAVIPPIGGG
jgi:molybdopterin converting factor subunit 1